MKKQKNTEKKSKKFFSHALKFKKLKKYTDKFFKCPQHYMNDSLNKSDFKTKMMHIEENEKKEEEYQTNSTSNPPFHEFLKNYFEYDPIKQRFFSKKNFLYEKYQLDPIQIYKKTSKISSNFINDSHKFVELNFREFYLKNRTNPSIEFYDTLADFAFLNTFKNIMNDSKFLDNDEFLFENCFKLLSTLNINLIKENLIDIKGLPLPKLNIFNFLIISVDSNDSKLSLFIQAVNLKNQKKSPIVIVKGPELSNTFFSNNYADAFLISELNENLALIVVVKDKIIKFELKVIIDPISSEILLSKPKLIYELVFPNINKVSLLNSDFLVLKHSNLRKIYKFNFKTKNLFKKDLGNYTLTHFDADPQNNLVICYTESHKIIILNENLEIIYNEIFMKIEHWHFIKSKEHHIELIFIRSGYNENQKFLYHLSFFYDINLKIWKALYSQVKSNYNDFVFFSKINLKFYEQNSTNILILKEKYTVSYDEKNSVKDLEYYSHNENQIIYKSKSENSSINENRYFIYTLDINDILFLIFEIQNNVLRVFYSLDKMKNAIC